MSPEKYLSQDGRDYDPIQYLGSDEELEDDG